jgi:hypothetical protein
MGIDLSEFEEVMERIKEETGANTQNELAKILNIRQATISEAKKRGRIRSDWLVKLSETHGLNPNYLRKGELPRYISGGDESAEPNHNIDTIQENYSAYPNFPGKLDQDSYNVQPKIIIPDTPGKDKEELVEIPFVSSGIFLLDETYVLSNPDKRYLPFPEKNLLQLVRDPKRAVCFSAEGDSMAPEIHDGDILMIDTSVRYIRTGWIYSLAMGGAITVKRLELLPDDRVRMISRKKEDYPAIEGDMEHIAPMVLGRVVWLCRTLMIRS